MGADRGRCDPVGFRAGNIRPRKEELEGDLIGALKTTARICAGAFAFAFLVIGCNHTGAGHVSGFIACGFCVAVFLLLRIRTKGDARREQVERERSKERMARIEAERAQAANYPAESRVDDGTGRLRGLLIGATVLQVLAFPFLVIADLLKMQK
jgi:hypothetical protein